MRCTTTLLRQDGGRILLHGHDTLQDPRGARAQFGYVAQQIALDKYLSGREHLRLQAALYHIPKATEDVDIASVLQLVGLTDVADRRIATYSGGMARRLDLATALLHKPRLLILDEPTVGLDIHTRTAIWDFIVRLANDGSAILIASHHIEEVEYLADRVVIVDHGKVVGNGTPAELKGTFGRTIIHLKVAPYATGEELAASVARLQESNLIARVMVDAADGGSVLAVLNDGVTANDDTRRALAGALGIAPDQFFQYGAEFPTLDDVFLSATGRTLRDAPWLANDTPPARRRR
jgi:ABC-2 type transport system ATP-binding protein